MSCILSQGQLVHPEASSQALDSCCPRLQDQILSARRLPSAAKPSFLVTAGSASPRFAVTCNCMSPYTFQDGFASRQDLKEGWTRSSLCEKCQQTLANSCILLRIWGRWVKQKRIAFICPAAKAGRNMLLEAAHAFGFLKCHGEGN